MNSQTRTGIKIGTLLLIAAAARAETVNVVVPGNTLGGFGIPSVDGQQPYIPALDVAGPDTVVIAYVSGTVTDGPGVNTGPDGTLYSFDNQQSPLQEAIGISGGNDKQS